MEPSIAGMVVFCGVFLIGRHFGSPLIIGTLASLAFGSTAIVTLSALGGSSPLLNVAFLSLLILATLFRTGFLRDLGRVFAQHPVAWLIVALSVYVVVGAVTLPRTFAGLTTVFVASRIDDQVSEVPLTPVSGNITQAAYFLGSVLSFFVFSVLLQERRTVNALLLGMFTFAVLHAGFGLIDLAAKLAGAGDVLFPIRTATYSLLTNVDEAGFARVVGAQAEASSFGTLSLGCLAFTFTYWRYTGDKFALILSAVLTGLLLLSTSSTAYVGFAIIFAFLFIGAAVSAFGNKIRLQDLGLLATGVIAGAFVLAIMLVSERALDPVMVLIDKTVVSKAASASAVERFYWNVKSMQAFIDTRGLGIGIGSSRASSWVIAVLSQFGMIGSVILGVLVVVLLRGLRGVPRTAVGADYYVLAVSMRACSLTLLIAATISGGSADPGICFFVALAAICSCRRFQSTRRRSTSATHSLPGELVSERN
ncbi:MAG: hypothetical protein JXQ99_00765 [Hyphomicrobiaceae bacterium]